MAVVRILIDGYSLLHGWRELAPDKPRHSAAAREELLHWLARYQDAVHIPITVFFDGAGAPPGTPKDFSSPQLEVIYSGTGQTADQLIERVAGRLREYGEVLVVTDDYAERDTILSLGGMASSCDNFVQTLRSTLDERDRELREYNRREQNRFKQSRHR